MANTIALTLTSNGTEIHGDSSQTTMGRANTIEVLSLTQLSRTTFERSTGLATGRRYHEPILFTKIIDRSSPLLRKALISNEVVGGSFEWFRPNPSGTGTVEQFYTMAFAQGRVVSAKTILPNTLDPGSASLPPLEEIGLVFNQITWTFEAGGVEFEDSWISTRS